GAEADRNNPRTRELRRLLGLDERDLVWVAGSTQAPEEEIVLDIFQRARADHPGLRLLLVPRQKERFEDVAALLRCRGQLFTRRSEIKPSSPCHLVTLSPCQPVILVDTIGELGAVWGLADVAFVGGSLDGRRGGQNMIEAAAYGSAVVFGPHVWNFRDVAARLVEAGGACQVADAAGLERVTARVLGSIDGGQAVGAAGRGV